MKYSYIILIASVLWVPGCADFGERMSDSLAEQWTTTDPGMSEPENFKYFSGTLVHLHRKILVVKSSNGETVRFKAGRRTVFTPNAWPNVGDKLRIRYFIKTYSHRQIGDYFIAFEVRRVSSEASTE